MVELNLKLPEGFLDEEVRDGYTVPSEIKKLWAVQLDLVHEFQRVCEKYHLRYFADAGTILGAVRHGGYIPWDDDIDLTMFREDYIRLCEIAPAEFRHPYFFQTEFTDVGSLRKHAQLRNSETTCLTKGDIACNAKYNTGIFIDIFPMDYLPDDENERNKYIAQIRKKQRRAELASRFTVRYSPSHGWKKIPAAILHYFSMKFYDGKVTGAYIAFEGFLKEHDSVKTATVAKTFWNINDKRIYRSAWFAGTVPMKFEMLTLPLPVGYEEILDVSYGDWRTPSRSPSVHGSLVFSAEIPYREYIAGHAEGV